MIIHIPKYFLIFLFVTIATIRLFVRQTLLHAPYKYSFWAWLFLVLFSLASYLLSSRYPSWSYAFHLAALFWGLGNSFLILIPLQVVCFFWVHHRHYCYPIFLTKSVPIKQLQGTLCFTILLQLSITLWTLFGGQSPSGSLADTSLIQPLQDDLLVTEFYLQESLQRWFFFNTSELDTLRSGFAPTLWIWLQTNASVYDGDAWFHTLLIDSNPLPTHWRAFQSIRTSSSLAGQELLFRSDSRIWTEPIPRNQSLLALQGPLGEAQGRHWAYMGLLPWDDRHIPNQTDVWILSTFSVDTQIPYLICNAGPDVFRKPPSTDATCRTQASLSWTMHSHWKRSVMPSVSSVWKNWNFADVGWLARVSQYEIPHAFQDTLASHEDIDSILNWIESTQPIPNTLNLQIAQMRWLVWSLWIAPNIQRRINLLHLCREYDVVMLKRIYTWTSSAMDDGMIEYTWLAHWNLHVDQFHSPRSLSILSSYGWRQWIEPVLQEQESFRFTLHCLVILRNVVLLMEASWIVFLQLISFFYPVRWSSQTMHLFQGCIYWILVTLITRTWYFLVLGVAYWDANILLMQAHDLFHMATAVLCLLILPFTVAVWANGVWRFYKSGWAVKQVKHWTLYRLILGWIGWILTGLLPQVGTQSIFPWIWHTPLGGSSWNALGWTLQGILNSFIWLGFCVVETLCF